MDEGNGLESRRPARVRGFESHPLRATIDPDATIARPSRAIGAERVGFEPTDEVAPVTALAGRRDQPTLPPLQVTRSWLIEDTGPLARQRPGSILEVAERPVAGPAEQPSDRAGAMVVIDDQLASSALADRAASACCVRPARRTRPGSSRRSSDGALGAVGRRPRSRCALTQSRQVARLGSNRSIGRTMPHRTQRFIGVPSDAARYAPPRRSDRGRPPARRRRSCSWSRAGHGPPGRMAVVDVQAAWPQLADRTAPALRDEERLVVVLREAVLALERSPPSSPRIARSHASSRGSLPVALVAPALLGGSAGLAEGVAAEAAALLEGELVEGLLLAAVPAALALLFHQHAPGRRSGCSGKNPEPTDGV